MLREITSRLSSVLAPRHDPFALHDEVSMEGYYTHLHSPSSSGNPCTLVIIFCEVKTAVDPSRRIMVYVLYAPGHLPPHSAAAASHQPGGFMRELTAPRWTVTRNSAPCIGEVEEWKIDVEGIGSMEVGKARQRLVVHIPSEDAVGGDVMDLVVESTQRTPWTTSSEVAGPEGPLERLSRILPIHWHVFSTASHAEWRITSRPSSLTPFLDISASVPPRVRMVASGNAIAHLEQNHGVGFPTGWIWAHSLSSHSALNMTAATATSPRQKYPVRFALAGGRILGLEAYLVGFRDDERGIEWDFTPPWSVALAGVAIGMKIMRSWAKRSVKIDVWDWGRWLSVEMAAKPETFIPIPGPLSNGFASAVCHESFQAHFVIKLYQRSLHFSWRRPTSWLSPDEWRWREVGTHEVDEGALEFGAQYAGERERGTKVHGE